MRNPYRCIGFEIANYISFDLGAGGDACAIFCALHPS